jgi:peptidase E
VYLTGGGPGTFAALRRHFKTAVAEIGSQGGARKRSPPLVAYVGAASNDDAGFFSMIRGALSATQPVRMRPVKLAAPRASASAARALMEDCDMVFMSGGDVEHGMRVLRDKDMVRPLRTLAREGKPMFGISAGSLMLAREWVRFPDDDSSKAEIFPCLGIAPLHVDAHSEKDGWDELRVLVDLLRHRGDARPVGHGLTRKGALRLALNRSGAVVHAVGTPIPRIVVRRGRIVDGAPLVPKGG